MAGKSAHEAAKAKAAKEKKILLALALPLVLAAFYAYHTLGKLHQSAAPTAAPVSATTPTSTTPTGTTESASSTQPLAAPVLGKLTSLTFLAAKDPFHDQGPRTSSGSSSSGSSSNKKAKGAKQPPPGPLTGAVIAVNGKLATVAIGTEFPVTGDAATNGIFRLVSLTRTTAKVSVVGGSYASGANTITLAVNVAVTLVNTADGKRYTLTLYPQGTLAPGAANSTTTPTTTTPTTTTSG